MNPIYSVPSRRPTVVARKTGDEYVLVPVSGNIADMDSVYTLNETGAFIWEMIDGKRTVEEIGESVMNEFDIDCESALKDTLTFMGEINKFIIINGL